MTITHPRSNWLFLPEALLLILALFATGCELDSFSSSGGSEVDQAAISLAELNGGGPGTAAAPEPEQPSAPEAEEEASAKPDPEPTPEPAATKPAPEPEPAPTPEPTPPPAPPPPVPSGSAGSYAPGRVVIPSAFLAHGPMTELRFQHCSVQNGRMQQISSTVYSLPPPSDPIWLQTSGKAIGTKARFANGAVYDGYVGDYTGSYSMPIQPLGQTSGRAFWVRMQ